MKITNAMIDEKIVLFTTDRAKLQNLGHQIALMVLNHAAPEDAGVNACGTGDCTRATKLAAEMPNSWAAQLSSWFEAFSPIRLNGAKVAYCDEYKALKISPDMTPEQKQEIREHRLTWWKLEDAAIKPFSDFKEPTPQAKPLDLAGLIKWLEAQAKGLEAKADGGKISPAEVETARALAEKLRAIKIVHIPVENDNEAAGEDDAVKLAAVA